MSDDLRSKPLFLNGERPGVFRDLVSELFRKKTLLSALMPAMAEKATKTGLQTCIMDSYVDIQAQILRLQVMMKLAGGETPAHVKQDKATLDLEGYIRDDIAGESGAKTDCLLIMHLLMIESVEITSYRLMEKLVDERFSDQLTSLISNSYDDAQRNVASLNTILDEYLKK